MEYPVLAYVMISMEGIRIGMFQNRIFALLITLMTVFIVFTS